MWFKDLKKLIKKELVFKKKLFSCKVKVQNLFFIFILIFYATYLSEYLTIKIEIYQIKYQKDSYSI